MKVSAQFATSLHSAEHIAAAEQLGYDRAWLFDTPHESPGSSQEVLHFLLRGQRHVEIDCRTEEDGNALEAFASGVAFADSVRPGNASTSNADPTRAI